MACSMACPQPLEKMVINIHKPPTLGARAVPSSQSVAIRPFSERTPTPGLSALQALQGMFGTGRGVRSSSGRGCRFFSAAVVEVIGKNRLDLGY